ncbi:MAG: hypothetical protein ACOYT9_01045 [Patescibacteria group bacterium]
MMKRTFEILVLVSMLLLAACAAPASTEETSTPVPAVAPANTVTAPVANGSNLSEGAPSEAYLQNLQAADTTELVAPNQIFRRADDENGVYHWVIGVGNLYDLPVCHQVPPVEDFCAKKTMRYFLLDNGYLAGPGAGTAHLASFANAKALLLAQGYAPETYVKILHSPFLHGTGFNPLHPGEGQVKVQDLDKLSGLGFVFTFAIDDSVMKYDPTVNYNE